METIMQDNQSFEQLRHTIEIAVGRKMKSARDFDFLADAINEKLHQTLSPSTLKRFWGYLPQYASMRTSTLDLLSQFVGYADWDSIDKDKRHELVKERNENLYFTVMRTNELRITFMKNLIDSNYVFLGIYRTDLQHSDSTHIVWERVADECDLNNLSYLLQLRH